MRGYRLNTSIGNIRAGEPDCVWTPSHPRPTGNVGAFLCHGATTPVEFASVDRWASIQLAGALADAGIPVVAAQMGGDSFGNDSAAMPSIDAGIARLNTLFGCNPNKVHLVGISMGGYASLRYRYLNPTRVASLTGIIPLCDIVQMYDANTDGLRASIGTAWGVTYPTPLPSGADLTAQTFTGGVPARLYYSGVDPFIPPTTVTAMGALIGADKVQEVDTGGYGHAEGTVMEVVDLGGAGTANEIIDWMIANGA